MALAAEVIGEEFAARTGDDTYRGCGEQVAEALLKANQQVRDILAEVPDDRRVLVTDHHAFGYFAAAYDFEIAGVVVPGGSTEAGPSWQELAALTEVMRAERYQRSSPTPQPRRDRRHPLPRGRDLLGESSPTR